MNHLKRAKERRRFEGRIRKDGKLWLAEISALDATTQGRTEQEARAMAKDLIETMGNTSGFEVTVHPTGKKTFEISANHVGTLVALLLRRQRERQDQRWKSGL